MNPFSAEADDDMPKPKAPPARIVLPKVPKPPKRDSLVRPLPTMHALAAFVYDVRSGLGIRQADLAARAGVSRPWIVALEQGRTTVEAGKVLRTLEALGFEVSVTPYDPPPAWMMRAVEAAHAKRDATLAARYRRKKTKREVARLRRQVSNVSGVPLDLG